MNKDVKGLVESVIVAFQVKIENHSDDLLYYSQIESLEYCFNIMKSNKKETFVAHYIQKLIVILTENRKRITDKIDAMIDLKLPYSQWKDFDSMLKQTKDLLFLVRDFANKNEIDY